MEIQISYSALVLSVAGFIRPHMNIASLKLKMFSPQILFLCKFQLN